MKERSPQRQAALFKRAVAKAACDQLVAELLPLVGNAVNFRKEALTTLICTHFPTIGYREAASLTAEELLPILSQIKARKAPSETGGGDTSGDTRKKSKKAVRRIRIEHCDCDRIYREAKEKGFPLTQVQVVQDYLDENPKCKLTPAALLKGWQAFRREQRKKDT